MEGVNRALKSEVKKPAGWVPAEGSHPGGWGVDGYITCVFRTFWWVMRGMEARGTELSAVSSLDPTQQELDPHFTHPSFLFLSDKEH